MKTNIFLPEKIKIGYQKREDTYTKKLAFVTYYDEKNVLRKEKSWEGWRDKFIKADDFDNVPISGFVLNKKVGGHSSGWNNRQTYTRIYDPRGFEFEITIQNLIYILENANSSKGKGLEGEFIYGWCGVELILLPIDSPDYKELQKFTENINNKKKINKKELVVGKTYFNKKNEKIVYLGEHIEYFYNGDVNGKKLFFYNENKVSNKLEILSSTNSLISEENIIDSLQLADMIFYMESKTAYSPFSDRKTYEDIKDTDITESYYNEFINIDSNQIVRFYRFGDKYCASGYNYTLEEIKSKFKFIQKYLKNGKKYIENL